MVSTKGYWDMINEHINESDLEYLESKEVIRPVSYTHLTLPTMMSV